MGSQNDVAVGTTSTSIPSVGPVASVTPGICGPIDLTIALDDTGSMGGAIGSIKAELPTIISTATTASGGDLKVGYITFKDDVTVHNELTTNISAVLASINATFASGGAGGPEASDEAKNTAVNNLPAGTRADSAGFNGTQTGNYTTPYRANATKIVVLITDAPPGGFNDFQDLADNIALNTTHALTALNKSIKVSDVFVPTGGDYAGQAALLASDANISGGAFITTAANGSGTGEAITSIIAACGGVVTPSLEGRMTGGGSVFNGSMRVTHGFELNCTVSSPSNNLQVNWGKGNRFHLESLTTATCSNDPAIVPNPPNATFDTYVGNGTGRYNGMPGATAHWVFTDAGEPGTSDSATIHVWDPLGGLVLSVSGNLSGGNHQAHNQ
ncbi:MAG: VWA domain-containing protein [Euryarchaeota archaeon]|nr:VWA domain-containing protein [Euryarchaeota archaeon]